MYLVRRALQANTQFSLMHSETMRVLLLVFVLLLGGVFACDCDQTALSCSSPSFAANTSQLYQDCLSYDFCTRAFYQSPMQDFELFESLLSQATVGFDPAMDAIVPLLCEPCTAQELQTRAVTFYSAFLVQSVRCAPGEVPLFDTVSGTFDCVCAPEHDCHPQSVSVYALVVVLISMALIVVAYTINAAQKTE
ncbi:MAG: hypothetical protein CMP20_01620 [Rickettsiales bacterium]|nr:hypothetical protein [Rickettsiales bacterium]